MDFRRVTGYLHEGPKLQLRAFPLFFLWQKVHRFAKTRKRIKSKEKKEGKARLIIFLGEEYIRLKAGTLLTAGLVPHFSVTGGNLGDRR